MAMNDMLTYENGGAVIAFCFGVALAIPRLWVRFRKQRHSHEERSLREMNSADMYIHDMLTELRIRLGAERAMVFQFHNGDHYLNGNPIQRVSCTHESVAGGYMNSRQLRMPMPVSMLAPIVDAVLADGVSVKWVDQLPDGHAKGVLEGMNVQAFVVKPLRHGKFGITGYLKVHWTTEPTLGQSEMQELLMPVLRKIEASINNRRMVSEEGAKRLRH